MSAIGKRSHNPKTWGGNRSPWSWITYVRPGMILQVGYFSGPATRGVYRCPYDLPIMCETVTGWQIHAGLCSVADADAQNKGFEITRFGGIKHCKYMIVLSDFSEKNTALFGVGHIMSPVQAISWGYLWTIHMFDRLLLPGQCTKMSSASSAPFFYVTNEQRLQIPSQKQIQPFWFGFQENWRKVSIFKYVWKVDFFQNDPFCLMNSHGTIGTISPINASTNADAAFSPKATDSSASSCFASGGLRIVWCFINILGISSMKINMDSKNEGLVQMIFLFKAGWFLGSMLIFQSVSNMNPVWIRMNLYMYFFRYVDVHFLLKLQKLDPCHTLIFVQWHEKRSP